MPLMIKSTGFGLVGWSGWLGAQTSESSQTSFGTPGAYPNMLRNTPEHAMALQGAPRELGSSFDIVILLRKFFKREGPKQWKLDFLRPMEPHAYNNLCSRMSLINSMHLISATIIFGGCQAVGWIREQNHGAYPIISTIS